MKNLITLATASFVIIACGSKQPTEIEKADVSEKVIQCFSAVTTKIGQEPQGIFDMMATISLSLSEFTPEKIKKSWSLLDNGNIILTVDNGETKYMCEYQKSSDNTWELFTVHRNSEKVFNKIEDDNNRNKNRIMYISKWHEKSYSNVNYKYYEKHDEGADQESERPTLRISCNPEGTRFQFGAGTWSSEKKVKVSFDNAPIEEYQLTSSADIGNQIKSAYGSYVVSDTQKDIARKKYMKTNINLKI